MVPSGAASGELVTEDPLAPFGVAFDPDAVLSAFDQVWPAGGVVLVEGSDLARANRYRPLATVDQQERLRRDALRRTDELVGELLARVDLDRDSVLVVGPYHSLGRVHLTVAGLHAAGARARPAAVRPPRAGRASSPSSTSRRPSSTSSASSAPRRWRVAGSSEPTAPSSLGRPRPTTSSR